MAEADRSEYYHRRAQRPRVVKRSVGTTPTRTPKRELELLKLENAVAYPEIRRPQTRGECVGGRRPCPFAACKHHLYIEVTIAGSLKINFPDLEPWELKESCALDVADRGEQRLEDVGALLNLTRERVRQLEAGAVRRFKANAELMGVEFESEVSGG